MGNTWSLGSGKESETMTYPTTRVIIAAVLLAFECPAQAPAELLQKGIYLQETAGDLDGALQIYRQHGFRGLFHGLKSTLFFR